MVITDVSEWQYVKFEEIWSCVICDCHFKLFLSPRFPKASSMTLPMLDTYCCHVRGSALAQPSSRRKPADLKALPEFKSWFLSPGKRSCSRQICSTRESWCMTWPLLSLIFFDYPVIDCCSSTTLFHFQSHLKVAMNVVPFPARLGNDDTQILHDFLSESYITPGETINCLANRALHHFQLTLPEHPLSSFRCFGFSVHRERSLGIFSLHICDLMNSENPIHKSERCRHFKEGIPLSGFSNPTTA